LAFVGRVGGGLQHLLEDLGIDLGFLHKNFGVTRVCSGGLIDEHAPFGLGHVGASVVHHLASVRQPFFNTS
jgi:hypothetical protein